MDNPLVGFWSYVHEDDEAESGRILRLENDIKAQYEMLTTERIKLFIDKDGISWGDKWRDVINDNLESAAFFIPVMTPRYFQKTECRREFRFFVQRAEKRGLKELLFPLHYVNVRSLSDDSQEDELILIARKTQWQDWRPLRYEEVESKAYRQAVFNLVQRLFEAYKRAEDVNIQEPESLAEDATADEANERLGTIDRMARMEEELPKWNDTINRLTEQTEVIGKKMQVATADLSKGGAQERFSNRIVILRRLAWELTEPASEIETLAREYVSH